MTYQAKKNWGPDDPVMETDYNRIETGIEDAHQLTKDLANELGGSFVVSGLTFNYSGLTATWAAGVAYVKGQRFSVPAGSIALNANQGQYIYLDTDGAIKKSTSQAVADGVCPLWYFTTNATTVLSYADRRNILNETLTVDQAQVPSSNTAKWPKFLSFFANRFKAITGETDWKNDPVKTIKQLWADLSNHLTDTVSHITAAERTDWNARETPSGAQAKVDSHANATSVHGATSAATASRIIMRDSSGRAKVAAPAAADDIARKDTVDAVQTNLNNHIGTGGSAHALATGSAAGFMSAADYTKLQGIQSGAEVNQNTFATIAVKNNAGTSKGSVAADSKQDTATFREGTAILMTADSATDEITISVDSAQFAPATHVGSGGAAHAVATQSAAGFMSAADYTKLQGIQAGATANKIAVGTYTGVHVTSGTYNEQTITVGFMPIFVMVHRQGSYRWDGDGINGDQEAAYCITGERTTNSDTFLEITTNGFRIGGNYSSDWKKNNVVYSYIAIG